MLNYIWSGIILIAFLSALLTGHIPELAVSLGDGARSAIETAFLLLGSMCFWSGLMRIAEASGIVDGFSGLLHPFIRLLFPRYAEEVSISKKITSNIAANLFGMGNAATPAGLDAMDEMQRLEQSSDAPTPEMIMFVVMNTAAFQLLPSSVVMLRASYGCDSPYDIMPHIWLASFGSLITCIIMCRVMGCIWKK